MFHIILLVSALFLFGLASANVTSEKVNFQAAGLACWMLDLVMNLGPL